MSVHTVSTAWGSGTLAGWGVVTSSEQATLWTDTQGCSAEAPQVPTWPELHSVQRTFCTGPLPTPDLTTGSGTVAG